ncbi:hypothetical protein LSAT2_002296 [Lamellibrachia satsuma]|nr:hypothetical protein LSAT2_002296 [Lamellibrachia satsuma]
MRHNEDRKRADKTDNLVERHSERRHQREEDVQGSPKLYQVVARSLDLNVRSNRYVVVKWERSCLDYSSFAYPVLDLDSRARFVETTRPVVPLVEDVVDATHKFDAECSGRATSELCWTS